MNRGSASVSQLAVEVFEDEQLAKAWLDRPNQAFGWQTPRMLCETAEGEKQVRRALQAMASGGVV